MDTYVTVVAAHHGDRLSAGTGDRQAANGDEFGLLDANRELVGALRPG